MSNYLSENELYAVDAGYDGDDDDDGDIVDDFVDVVR